MEQTLHALNASGSTQALREWTAASLPGGIPTGQLGLVPLKVEASHRRFFRVSAGTDPAGTAPSYVVMESPPNKENNDQFVALAQVFARAGINVPRLLAGDRGRGYFLMTDLGSVHLEDLYGNAATRADALDRAIETLLRIQQISDPKIPPYTTARFQDELHLFNEWLIQRWLNLPVPDFLQDVFQLLVSNTQEQPQCCVHRDFHCRNLLLSANGQIGVVDFQDALIGPASYDLASLLRDCYHRFAEEEVVRWRDEFLARSPLPLDRERFGRQLDLAAVQRQLKAVGIFARLDLRDGKTSHLPHIAPVLRQLLDLSGHYPELADLHSWLPEILTAAEKRRPETTDMGQS